ncbi:hypothetical protein R6Q57_021523 [Mikania cordata]
MYETAKGIVLNLIDLIDTYGYVLNGARAYYTNRSQPPLLSSMVIEVYKQINDIELVKKALPALIKEHKFWNSVIHNVTIEDSEEYITVLAPLIELDISFLATVVGESSHALHFARDLESRKKVMDIGFWDEEKGQWFDYWLNDSSNQMGCC